jgi:hypothetical protein
MRVDPIPRFIPAIIAAFALSVVGRVAVAAVAKVQHRYIGYSDIDDYGNEEIYWFPVEVIYEGDTGAVECIPLSS